MKILQLTEPLYNCPKVWINFINELRGAVVHGADGSPGFTTEFLNSKLEIFGGTFIDSVGTHTRCHVVFEDNEGLTAFTLRYI